MISMFVERFQAVLVLTVIIFFSGIIAYLGLPRESAPEIRRPLIFVNTIYSGVSASDMETLVTKPIEDELDGLEGLDKLTSTSRLGLSSVIAEFTGDTDVEVALRRVKERVDVAKATLPQDIEDPAVRELNFSDQPFLIVVLSNPNGLETLEGVSEFLEEEIKAIPGVLDVRLSGNMTRELAIELDPAMLKHYKFSIDDVINTVRKEHITIPGGIMRNSNQNYSIAITGEIKDERVFEDLVVEVKGRRARLKDLGQVSLRFKDPETIARMNGEPAISVSITKRAGENIIRIVDDVKKLIADNKFKFPHATKMTYSYDESTRVKDMVYDLENNIFTSFIMVVAVTLFFLGPVNAVFVSIGIPFSMLISFVVLSFLGVTLNMVVLFSLVLALGMLVDNGIVIVENIYRHRFEGKSKVKSAIEGAAEVALPITTSTITTVLAFFPIIFMPGIMGEFMSWLPLTVIVVLFSSLAVALTITPTLCSRFLNISRKNMEKMTGGGGRYERFLKRYEGWLVYCLVRPVRTLLVSSAFVVLGIMAYGTLGKAPIFFPSLDPDVAIVSIEVPPGASLEVTDKVTKEIANVVPSVPASLENLQDTVGRSSSGGLGQGGGVDPAKANLRLGFVPYIEREVPAKDTIESLKKALEDFTDAKVKVQEMKNGPPQGHPISYEIRGEEYAVIGLIAEQIKEIISIHKEAFEDIDYDYEKGKPEIKVDIDRERAAMYGLGTRKIASTVRNSINGGLIGKFRKGKEEYDVVVRYLEPYRDSVSDIRELEVIEGDARVPLASLGTIAPESAVTVIKRNGRRRAVNVWADFKPDFDDRAQVENVKDRIDEQVRSIQLPAGYAIVTGEGNRDRDASTQFLLNAFLLAVGMIFLVLVVQFNSVTQPMIIMISVILSLGGVFWGLLLSGKTFVIIMSGIGVISLAGVVVNNAIVMIDFMNVLRNSGLGMYEAVLEAAKTRLRPVLLTALTTVIGLLPMGFAISFDFHTLTFQIGSQSAQWFRAMAWAIIFGLSFATVLTTIVVPCLLLLDGKVTEWFKELMAKKAKHKAPVESGA